MHTCEFDIIKINREMKGVANVNTWKALYRYRYLYALLLPALALMILFHYLPMYGIQLAFKDYRFASGISGSDWAGFKYFIRMFSEPKFINVLRNTFVISFGKLLFSFPAPIFLALLLNEIRLSWYKRVAQTISYLPHFMSWVVLAGIFKEFLSLRGPINFIIERLGGKPQLLMVDQHWFVQIIIATDVWKTVGWGSIIYLAAIAGIDRHLYEAAEIDGAGRLRQMWHITLPALVPVIFLLFLLTIGNLLGTDFDQLFNMYSPLVYAVGDVIDTYTYRVGLVDMNFSYATAIGLFKNAIGLCLLLIVNFSMKRYNQYGV